MSGEPPGLQSERTALAWNRTALSLLAASAAITRLTYEAFGLYSVACTAICLPLASWVFWESRSRYRHANQLRRRATAPDGVAAASVALIVVVVGLTEFVALGLG